MIDIFGDATFFGFGSYSNMKANCATCKVIHVIMRHMTFWKKRSEIPNVSTDSLDFVDVVVVMSPFSQRFQHVKRWPKASCETWALLVHFGCGSNKFVNN